MREILFRGKRADNGEWVMGNLFIPDNPETPTQICIRTNIVRITYDIDPETVGQYTGLTDKNGKKIFEDDIVNFKTTAYYFKNCRIKYQSCYGRYCAIDNHGYEYPMDETFEYEVIGNIYDNPNLMKGAAE